MTSAKIGNLEAVYIKRETKSVKFALGFFGNDERVLVNCPREHIGKTCLARIEFGPDRKWDLPRASFINSEVPSDFSALSWEKYFLVGIWTPGMRKNSRYPTLDEINHYFSIMKMGAAYFITSSGEGVKEDKVEILPAGVTSFTKKSFGTTFFYVARSFRNGGYSTPIIIQENEALKSKLESAILNRGALPVYLE